MNEPIPDTTLVALINLLDEPDESAYRMVRERIISLGPAALQPLQRSLENTFDGIVRDRIRCILRKLYRDSLFSEFSDWLENGSSDLLKGFMLVTKTKYPSLDEANIMMRLEQIRMDIWIELNDNLTPLETIRVMNHLLFDIHRFEGNADELKSSESNFINNLLDSRKGSPLSMGILYLILARKLGLPVYGVDLAHHFVLAYMSAPDIGEPEREDVLFYLNPLSSGTVFTGREIDTFLKHAQLKPEKSHYLPCSNIAIIRRLITSLVFACRQEGDTENIEDLETLLSALE